MKTSTISGLAVAILLAASPVFAQSAGTNGSATANAPHSGTTTGTAAPAAPDASTRLGASTSHNPVFSTDGAVRASKVIGSTVYNDKDEKVGSIDDILLGSDNKPAQVVLSVGGFLGLGAKLVEVPYDKLQFGNTAASSDNRVKMPGATKDSLTSMSSFSYASNG